MSEAITHKHKHTLNKKLKVKLTGQKSNYVYSFEGANF